MYPCEKFAFKNVWPLANIKNKQIVFQKKLFKYLDLNKVNIFWVTMVCTVGVDTYIPLI